MSSHTMTVTFDKAVSSSILEAGYNYNPSSNNTITVEFDQDGRDIYDILEDAGLGHLSDEVIYTNYYADCLQYYCSSLQRWQSKTMQRVRTAQTFGRVPTIQHSGSRQKKYLQTLLQQASDSQTQTETQPPCTSSWRLSSMWQAYHQMGSRS